LKISNFKIKLKNLKLSDSKILKSKNISCFEKCKNKNTDKKKEKRKTNKKRAERNAGLAQTLGVCGACSVPTRSRASLYTDRVDGRCERGLTWCERGAAHPRPGGCIMGHGPSGKLLFSLFFFSFLFIFSFVKS
jgi:hypothetical protein